jgi:hypothetical protein
LSFLSFATTNKPITERHMKSLATALVLSVSLLASAAPAYATTVSDAIGKWTLYSDATAACVTADAKEKLSPGQYDYLVALLDSKGLDAMTARKDAGITLGEAVQVHTFLWLEPARCAMKK